MCNCIHNIGEEVLTATLWDRSRGQQLEEHSSENRRLQDDPLYTIINEILNISAEQTRFYIIDS